MPGRVGRPPEGFKRRAKLAGYRPRQFRPPWPLFFEICTITNVAF